MRFFIIFMVVLSFHAAGYAFSAKDTSVDVYTFKKDRVDQEIDGNQGYIMGKPGTVPLKARKSKRTLIGVDIELPMTADEDEEDISSSSRAGAGESLPQKKETYAEEEWIK